MGFLKGLGKALSAVSPLAALATGNLGALSAISPLAGAIKGKGMGGLGGALGMLGGGAPLGGAPLMPPSAAPPMQPPPGATPPIMPPRPLGSGPPSSLGDVNFKDVLFGSPSIRPGGAVGQVGGEALMGPPTMGARQGGLLRGLGGALLNPQAAGQRFGQRFRDY